MSPDLFFSETEYLKMGPKTISPLALFLPTQASKPQLPPYPDRAPRKPSHLNRTLTVFLTSGTHALTLTPLTPSDQTPGSSSRHSPPSIKGKTRCTVAEARHEKKEYAMHRERMRWDLQEGGVGLHDIVVTGGGGMLSRLAVPGFGCMLPLVWWFWCSRG